MSSPSTTRWMRGRKFLLVPYHLPDSQSPGRRHPRRLRRPRRQGLPRRPLPDVYVTTSSSRTRGRPAAPRRRGSSSPSFRPATRKRRSGVRPTGTPRSLDEAFAQPPGGAERRRLVGDLLAGPFKRYARAVRADQESYVPLDEGLSVISKHAKNVLGFDAIVLLLDELVLWLAGYIGDHVKVSIEAQKVSKLIESAELERPAPMISFVPRQRDLRDLVRKAAAGNEVTSLFDTLKYWDGRFDHIPLDRQQPPGDRPRAAAEAEGRRRQGRA